MGPVVQEFPTYPLIYTTINSDQFFEA